MWIALPLAAIGPAEARKPNVMDMTLELPATAPPNPWGEPRRQKVGSLAKGARGPDREEVVVESGKLSTRCLVTSGWATAIVEYDTNNYPEHLPEVLECTVGENVLRVGVVAVANEYGRPEELWVDPVAGVDVRHHPGGRYTHSVEFAFADPLDLLPATVRGERDGKRWGDLSCEVVHEPHRAVRIDYTDEAPDGEGTCALPTPTGTHLLRVRVRTVALVVVPPA